MCDYRKKYIKLNQSFSKRLVYRLGSDMGFFSEIRLMAQAMLWCLENKIRFELYSDNANFSSRPRDGWTEFFEPFCPTVHGKWNEKFNRHSMPTKWSHINSPQAKLKVSYFNFVKWRVKQTLYSVIGHIKGKCLLSSDVPNGYQKHYYIPELDIDGCWLDALCRMIEVFWHPHCLIPLNLPESYLGCQLRGGDKVTEVDLVNPLQVIDRLVRNTPPL